MEAGMIILLLAALVVIFFCKGALDEKRKKREARERIHKEFGAFRDREYSDGELAGIPGFFAAHRRENQIDDITWNDLGMDEIYFRMNHTYSSAGQEYLYYALRTPALCREETEGTEERISWFLEHQKEREALQYLYLCLGRSGKYSIYDYLSYLDNLGDRSSMKSIVCDLLLALSLLVIPFSLSAGLAAFFVMLMVNMFLYMKQKGEVEPYLASFSYVRRILDFCIQLRKVSVPVLEEEWKELETLEKKFGKFRRSAILGMRGSTLAGDPLSILMDYFNMIFHLDVICFNSMLGEIRKKFSSVDRMVELAGRTEFFIAVASYRASLGNGWCSPVFEEGKELYAESVYHPLLEEPVKNTIRAGRGILITGSNASGKSTFLKTVAVNALLAQTIHTCCADSYRAGVYRIFSSMALRDNLAGGESYYIVEIRALKRILDAAGAGGVPVLCFVDEVLRGTNTVERIAASTQILKSLNGPAVLCFAATHDIELTRLLEKEYDNYHFEEQIEENDIHFNYTLMPGRAMTRNAIRLLGIMGYPEEIIREAERLATVRGDFWDGKQAEAFLKDGNRRNEKD